MHELKFRIWDGEKFIYSDSYTECETENENLAEFLNDYFGYKPQQYIYEIDCCNTEIYENDIVKDTESDAANSWGIITLDPNKWGGEPFITGNPDAFCYKGFLELLARGRIQVIGNTCQNPDLPDKLREENN